MDKQTRTSINNLLKKANKVFNTIGLIILLALVVVYTFILWKNNKDDLTKTGGKSTSGEYTFSKRLSDTSTLDIGKAIQIFRSLPEDSDKIYNTAQIMLSYGGIIESVNFEGSGNNLTQLNLKVRTYNEEDPVFNKVISHKDLEKLQIYKRTENGPIILNPYDLVVGQQINITEIIYLFSDKEDLLIIDLE